MKKRILVLAVLLGLLSACTGVARTEGPEALTASGIIRATELRVASELGGRVAEVRPQVGAAVAAGETLALLDPTPYELQLGPTEAAVAVAQADLALLLAGATPAQVEAAQAALTLAVAERAGAGRESAGYSDANR